MRHNHANYFNFLPQKIKFLRLTKQANASARKTRKYLFMLEYSEYFKMLIGLIAIINPIGAIPIFLSITSDYNTSEKRMIAVTATTSVLIILLVSLYSGELILDFFGISINSFRVAGGLLILLMAIAMLHAKTSHTKQTSEELDEVNNKKSIAIVPLAIPLLAGPGAISTVILYAHKGSGLWHYSIITTFIVIICLFILAIFWLLPYISKYISKTGTNIFTRIMGLILAAIAIEFIANGLKGLFPVLN